MLVKSKKLRKELYSRIRDIPAVYEIRATTPEQASSQWSHYSSVYLNIVIGSLDLGFPSRQAQRFLDLSLHAALQSATAASSFASFTKLACHALVNRDSAKLEHMSQLFRSFMEPRGGVGAYAALWQGDEDDIWYHCQHLIENLIASYFVGGDVGESARLLDGHPPVDEFGKTHRLFTDTLRALAIECIVADPPRPERLAKEVGSLNIKTSKNDFTLDAVFYRPGLTLLGIARDRGWAVPADLEVESLPVSLLSLEPFVRAPDEEDMPRMPDDYRKAMRTMAKELGA